MEDKVKTVTHTDKHKENKISKKPNLRIHNKGKGTKIIAYIRK